MRPSGLREETSSVAACPNLGKTRVNITRRIILFITKYLSLLQVKLRLENNASSMMLNRDCLVQLPDFTDEVTAIAWPDTPRRDTAGRSSDSPSVRDEI